ncbi:MULTISPECIES: co-chaperone YbbN [unclassified Lentimicrobium]|uniref:thioredoxin family protein n=1 Tax=unclassified Lentimicrobium TaxID=2677434 RepID=UPI001556CA86|nr:MULTISPECIES: thioredoxin domain-containing protein [unclassified Lentimicrobium]NPD45913.1 thioredoxin [Lentimicrobium sp. S6]NPD85922.1 thioredoxin [Lentimicrobium sp. L6]
MIKDLNFTNFNTELAKGWVLVDYWAFWCIPCLTQDPIVQELAEQLKGILNVAKVDINENKYIANERKIRNIPMLVLYHNGEEIERFAGLQSKETILNNKHIKNLI